MDLSKCLFHSTPVQVKLPNFSLEYQDEEVFKAVANSFGCLVSIENATLSRRHLVAIRLCVMIDHDANLLDSILFNSKVVIWKKNIIFESFPFACFKCKKLGYWVKDYTSKVVGLKPKVWKVKEVKDSIVPHFDQVTPEEGQIHMPIVNFDAILQSFVAKDSMPNVRNATLPSGQEEVDHVSNSLSSPNMLVRGLDGASSPPLDYSFSLLGGDTNSPQVNSEFRNKDEDGLLTVRGRKKKQNFPSPSGHKGVTTRRQKLDCGSECRVQGRPSFQKIRERESKDIMNGVQKTLFDLCSKSTPSSCK